MEILAVANILVATDIFLVRKLDIRSAAEKLLRQVGHVMPQQKLWQKVHSSVKKAHLSKQKVPGLILCFSS